MLTLASSLSLLVTALKMTVGEFGEKSSLPTDTKMTWTKEGSGQNDAQETSEVENGQRRARRRWTPQCSP